jgi:ribA/ribD-fused uncharacterized protein
VETPHRPLAANCQHLTELRTAVAAGKLYKYLFFWGNTSYPGAPLGKECLSQWYAAPFTINGLLYRTAEHWMMAEKARLFGDEATRAAILAATHPNEAKLLGREVQPYDENQWLQHRFGIVVAGNLAKFSQYPALALFLQQTGSRVLVEASPVDSIWGIGLAPDDPRAASPLTWAGQNLLGFALMEVRARLHEPGHHPTKA